VPSRGRVVFASERLRAVIEVGGGLPSLRVATLRFEALVGQPAAKA